MGSSDRGGSKKQQRRKKKGAVDKDWVMAKKEKRRQAGKDVRRDSRYTARKRKDKF